ncbi:MAG: adenine phosphoribosyltransferase [Candidatus Shapirobacteria bacterium]|nr:adenine phosphoribosyltransferase [Candidatus Shapirobacteria bacterium]
MNFKEVFSNNKVVLPVVHVKTEKQTLNNVFIAKENGADGAFLISMEGMNHHDLLKMYEVVQKEVPTFWLGINYLDLRAIHVFENLNSHINGAWVDDAEIFEQVNLQLNAEKISEARKKSGWKGLYFGGVAFKYQREVNNYKKVAEIAKHYMDVITTSGTQTGSAPDLRKIEIMKEAVGDSPLAIASGISPENVGKFKKVADCFLVATSILKPGTEDFDPSKVKELIEAVRG